ncbi:SDR family NAD(P)-dependent oxidoreductase [Novosphingobium sp.]|uniref:SDR family NAD(P)-dependent oxidoreductase n=1 Tax=Novosphingobium sp. TaxID=1874826 RepID=UPI00273365E4|nr:SDR family oxidoreductase [Novosphingobium sp.]MDP3908698.1 SDR family oxidoreductase [Novosphingobium sp.]
MEQLLAGKVAIVTGGANGLGKAAVERFAAEGARVVIADMDCERGEALAAQLGGAARFLATNVAEADQVQALIDFAVSEFDGLDVMFNNAGVSQAIFPRFVDDDLSDFQKVINVNLLGVMLGTQRAARHMKDHGGGSIINAASIGGSQAGCGILTYRASKAAVIHFTKCTAIDLAEYGIRVNCISPGNIETEMSAFPGKGMSDEMIRKIHEVVRPLRLAAQPLKRWGKPLDIANAALYLASDMSAQITGQELVVDGGASTGDPINRFIEVAQARARIIQEISS